MSVEATGGIGGLEAFLRLVGDARIRNGGLEVPVRVVREEPDTKNVAKAYPLKNAGSLSRAADGPRTASALEKPRQILGTHFDAYA